MIKFPTCVSQRHSDISPGHDNRTKTCISDIPFIKSQEQLYCKSKTYIIRYLTKFLRWKYMLLTGEFSPQFVEVNISRNTIKHYHLIEKTLCLVLISNHMHLRIHLSSGYISTKHLTNNMLSCVTYEPNTTEPNVQHHTVLWNDEQLSSNILPEAK